MRGLPSAAVGEEPNLGKRTPAESGETAAGRRRRKRRRTQVPTLRAEEGGYGVELVGETVVSRRGGVV